MGGVRVFLNGVNVTPQSLLSSSARRAEGKKPAAGAADAAGRRKASKDAPVKRPSGGGVAPRKKPSLSTEQSAATAARTEGGQGGSGGTKSPTGRRKRAGEGVIDEGGLTEEDLTAPITIGLCETPTLMLLEIRGSAVATDLRHFGRCAGSQSIFDRSSGVEYRRIYGVVFTLGSELCTKFDHLSAG